MSPFTNISIPQLKRAIRLREKIEMLESQFSKIMTGDEMPTPLSPSGKRNRMSLAGRRRIAAAQKLRWAKQKGETETVAKKSRRKMSAAARAKISAAATARWAKIKAATKG